MKKASVIGLMLLLAITACKRPELPPDASRVWLHRVNSIEKAQRFQYDYPGFELDVHYCDSLHTFLIKHDADETSTLTLDAWCAAIDNISALGLWFDFKNLDSNNREAALACLRQLRDDFHLEGKLYVESPRYHELQAFKEAGFRVSYYIPFFLPQETDSALCQQYRNEIQNAILTGVTAISGYDFQYDFMKTEFPAQTKLIWTIDPDTVAHAALLRKLEPDTTVDVILLPNNL